MTLQTSIARFVVDHEKVTEEGGRLRTFQRRRVDEPEVDLHILAEPSGAKGEELGAQALDAIGRLFLQDRLSLTGGLLRSLKATHQTLLDWNRRSLPREQASAGLTAAVVSDNIVYVAQAGPSLVYVRRGGQTERYVTDEEALSPLGENDLEPHLRRFELAPGDIIVGSTTTIEDFIDPSRIDDLLSRGAEAALPEIYLTVRGQENFGLFALTCVETPDEPSQDQMTPAERSLLESRRSVAHAGDDGRGEQETHMAFAEPGFGAGGPPAALSAHDLDHRTEPPPAKRVERARPEREEPRRDHEAERPRRTLQPAMAVASQPLARAGFSNEPVQAVPMVLAQQAQATVLVAPAPLDISRRVVRLRGTGSIGRGEYARTTGEPTSFRLNVAPAQIAMILGALAVVLFVGFFAVPDLIRENRGAKVESLIDSAHVQYAAALAATDAGEKRRLLDDVRSLSAQALRIEPLNTEAGELRQQAATALGGLDAIFDLGPMTTVTTLGKQVTGEVSVQMLTVAGSNAYMLDAKGGRILQVPTAGGGAPVIVFQDGDTYEGTPAKKPQYLTWAGDPATGQLLVLDAERKLFAVRPGATPQPVPLRRTNTWASVAGIAAYDDNLYVLDPKGHQVHRYLPSANGYDSEPSFAVSAQGALADAVSLAVDGDIFVVRKDGGVNRYRNGSDIGFDLSAIDREIKTPTDIVAAGTTDEVYIADSGNKRVVVASQDGAFKRQLVSNALTDVRSLAVDPMGSQLFVVVGDALLMAPIVR